MQIVQEIYSLELNNLFMQTTHCLSPMHASGGLIFFFLQVNLMLIFLIRKYQSLE